MFNEAHKAQYLLDSHDSHITELHMTHGITCTHAYYGMFIQWKKGQLFYKSYTGSVFVIIHVRSTGQETIIWIIETNYKAS